MITEAEYWRTLDSNGQVMPWYSRDVCAWLDTIDFKGKRVFEYGGGQSTIWYRGQGADVSGVDSDPQWAEMSGLKYVTDLIGYTGSIDGEFNFICIDGIYRDECFVFALNHLKEGGFIIIDNWKDEVCPDWPETDRLIAELNLIVKSYRQAGHPTYATAIITR